MDERWAATFDVTVPSEESARIVAGELATRGHLLVTVRIVDHFHFDPDSWWYGKPSMQPEFTGWWQAFSVLVLPPGSMDSDGERDAVQELARAHGGVANRGVGGGVSTVTKFFPRVGLVSELTLEEADRRRPELPPRPEPLLAAPPLTYRPTEDPDAELAAIVERLEAVIGGPVEVEPEDSAGSIFGDLFNHALHQDTVDEDTAGLVPHFVMLAGDDRLGDMYRVWAVLDLFEIATVGRRLLGALQDTNRALGRAEGEEPDAVAAREAVAAGLPALLTRWDRESTLWRLVAAAVATSCGVIPPDTGDLRRSAPPGSDRALLFDLMDGTAAGEENPWRTVEKILIAEVDRAHSSG